MGHEQAEGEDAERQSDEFGDGEHGVDPNASLSLRFACW
jgi:hypothetical protein